MKDRLSFERFEYKYIVPDERAAELAEYLAPYLVRDRFSAGLPEGRYLTTNLYLDSPSYSFYWAHKQSAVDRFKLRVRFYGEGPVCFFEIKRKIRDVIVKHRAAVPREKFEGVMRGDIAPTDATSTPEYLEEFLGLMTIYGAEPKFLIRYQREAYDNVFDEDARITFDRKLCFQSAESLDLVGDPHGWTYIDGSNGFLGEQRGTLLEMKFSPLHPPWLPQLVRTFELRRIQFSKYLTTVFHHHVVRLEPWDAMPRSRLTLPRLFR